VVLDRIVGAAWKKRRNFRPLCSVHAMCVDDQSILFLSPALFLNVWVEMVVPSLSALLAYPSGQE
jgi:hypothetical protein